MSRPVLPESADVVIVGAGTAGGLLAHRLAERTDREVLVLEDGPAAAPGPETTSLQRLPIGPGADRVRVIAERHGRPVVRGWGAGGSAAVNGGYFLRQHAADIAAWPEPWPELAPGAYDAVDGGDSGGGLLSVHGAADADLGDVPRAFEEFWRRHGLRERTGAWPVVGLNRVRSNVRDGQRMTTARVLAEAGGPTVVGGSAVTRVLHDGQRVTGVDCDGRQVTAGEVIVCAGTLGTAELLRRSGLPGFEGDRRWPVYEHAEVLVRFTPRREVRAPALLQSVVHTADGLEIRCYGDDFAEFIGSGASRGIAVGVSDMAEPVRGAVGPESLDLGWPEQASLDRMTAGARRVVEMLHAEEFAELVLPGSVQIDSVIGMNQHSFGTLPLGVDADPLGAVAGLEGLRVVDGSLLPPGGRSGPHATIAMLAWAIGGLIP